MDPWSPEWFLRSAEQTRPCDQRNDRLAEFPPPQVRDLEPQDRVSKRVPVELGAGLRQRGAHGVSVQILDLSTHGFRASTHLVLHEGCRRLAAPAGPRSLAGQGRLGERLYHRLRVRTAASPRRARDDRQQVATTPEPACRHRLATGFDPIRILQNPVLSHPSRRGGTTYGIGFPILFAAGRGRAAQSQFRRHRRPPPPAIANSPPCSPPRPPSASAWTCSASCARVRMRSPERGRQVSRGDGAAGED